VGFQIRCIDRHGLFFALLGGQTRHHPGKTPLSFHRFQRLYSVLFGPYALGASRHLKPLRLIKITPLRTRLSSTQGLPWDSGNEGSRRTICASLSHKSRQVHRSFFEPRNTPPRGNQWVLTLAMTLAPDIEFHKIRQRAHTTQQKFCAALRKPQVRAARWFGHANPVRSPRICTAAPFPPTRALLSRPSERPRDRPDPWRL
jgi:hypothetical protein